jgi:hypothetical protein
MRIAMLISGRAARYEVCLLPILEACEYDIDLFLSINDNDGLYYSIMREKLAKWVKGLYIKPYIIPADFKTEFRHNDYTMCYQKINGVWLPRNQLSMYYNDNNAFNMACDYSVQNGFEYDIFMRFRSDIFNIGIPKLLPVDPSSLVLHSILPFCIYSTFGKHKRRAISSDWVWGNKKTMAIYCNTYEYVLNENNKMNGTYLFHFESNHADNMIDNSVQIEYHNIKYDVDANRKLFDDTWKLNEDGSTNDSRGILPRNNTVRYIDNSNITDTFFVPNVPELV